MSEEENISQSEDDKPQSTADKNISEENINTQHLHTTKKIWKYTNTHTT